MTHPTFSVDETYGPRFDRDVSDIEAGDRDVDWIPNGCGGPICTAWFSWRGTTSA